MEKEASAEKAVREILAQDATETPAFAYVLYTPPFDGEGRVRVSGDE